MCDNFDQLYSGALNLQVIDFGSKGVEFASNEN